MNFPGPYTLTDSERDRVEESKRLGEKGREGVAGLIDMLTDPSWVVRRAVVETLAEMGQPAVEPLCESLRTQRDSEARIAAAVDALSASSASVEISVLRLAASRDPAIVADAAQILGRRRSQSSVPALIQLTRHENDNVAVAAIEALGRIGGRAAVEALSAATESGNFFRTFPAIDVLGRSGDPRVVAPLARLLGNPNYLPEAARALGRSGERSAVKPLLKLLTSQSDTVVRVAAAAIWELRERFEEKSGGDAIVIDELIRSQVARHSVRRLAQAMSTADAPEAGAICRLLGAIGSPEAAPLLASHLDSAPAVASCAAESLKKIGRNADDSLFQAIREGSSARRKLLLPIVTRSAAAPDVALCLTDPDSEVRALACDSLARLGNPDVVSQIFPLLSDSNLRVVHSATAAIQALGTRRTRELAVEATRSQSPVVRRSALRILAYFGDDMALEPMLAGLRDSDARVREAAIQGLPLLEGARAAEALFEETRSSDVRTRALAMRAIGQMPRGSERAYSLLLKGLSDADAWVRYYACQSLGRLAYAPAATEIARLLEDEAGQVRVSAVESLSHLDSAEAQECLRQAAESDDIEVKRAALVGLGIAHRANDLPVVLAAASSADVPTRLMALSAMVSFPSPRVLGALSSAATDPDEQIRSAAVGFLSARPEQEATEILVELLRSVSTREQAKTALRIPSEGRVSGLLVALESADDELAALLLSVLARFDQPDSRAALLSALKLPNPAARKAAAGAIATRREPEMLTALREAALNDPDSEVRQICAILLRG